MKLKLEIAELWTVIEDEKVEKFQIEIIEIRKQSNPDIKGIKIKVTDQRLINKTGGIIQGMSGRSYYSRSKNRWSSLTCYS